MRPTHALRVAVFVVAALLAAPAAADADELLDTITHDAAKRTVTVGTAPLTAGTRYVLEATGTKDSKSTESGFGFRYDALYCYGGIGFDHEECVRSGPSDHGHHDSGFRVAIEGAAATAFRAIDGFGGPVVDYDPNHSYTVPFTAPSSGRLAVGDDYAFGVCGPGSGCVNQTTGSYTVKIFGPAAAQPPPSATATPGGGGGDGTPTPCAAASVLRGRVCADKLIQFGVPAGYDAPSFGKPITITSADIPPQTTKVLLELGIDDPEIQRIVVTMMVRQRAKRRQDELEGCILMGQLIKDYGRGIDGGRIGAYLGGKNGALFHGCTKFLVGEYEAGRGRSAHIAADGCDIYFVPLFPKGKPINKRRRAQQLRLAPKVLTGSCTATRNTFSGTLGAQGKARTVNRLFDGRMRTAVASIAPKGAKVRSGSHLAVKWSVP